MMPPSKEELVAMGVLKPEVLLRESGVLSSGETPTLEHYVAHCMRRIDQTRGTPQFAETVTGLQGLMERINARPASKNPSVAQRIAGEIDFGNVDWPAVVKVFEDKRLPLQGLTRTLNDWGFAVSGTFFEWKNPKVGGWERVLQGKMPQIKEAYFGLRIEW
jgi:hypothetical protein